MPSMLLDSHGNLSWNAVVGVFFALVFLGVGLARVVEFSGLGLSRAMRAFLITGHVLGCLLFSASLAVLGMDSLTQSRQLIGSLLFSGVVILFPIHIYIGLKRRILQKKALGE